MDETPDEKKRGRRRPDGGERRFPDRDPEPDDLDPSVGMAQRQLVAIGFGEDDDRMRALERPCLEPPPRKCFESPAERIDPPISRQRGGVSWDRPPRVVIHHDRGDGGWDDVEILRHDSKLGLDNMRLPLLNRPLEILAECT